jgi:hypothetical protein
MVDMIMTREDMEEAIPSAWGPTIFAVTNQNTYVKIELPSIATERYHMFLLALVSASNCSPYLGYSSGFRIIGEGGNERNYKKNNNFGHRIVFGRN